MMTRYTAAGSRAARPRNPRRVVEAWVADALRECAEYGRQFGVIIAVQNHGDFINTGEQHRHLLERVNHEWCGALVDTGKFHTPDPYVDIALMAPYAVNWQIKGARTDFRRLVGIIRDSGYRGCLPIETLSMGRKDHDPRVEVSRMIVELRTAIAAAL